MSKFKVGDRVMGCRNGISIKDYIAVYPYYDNGEYTIKLRKGWCFRPDELIKLEGTMSIELMKYSELYTVFEKLLDRYIVLKNEASIHSAELRLREAKGDDVKREIEINAMVESFINNKMKFPVACFEMKRLEE